MLLFSEAWRALEWGDIDFETRKMSITKTAYMAKEGKTIIREITKGKQDRTIIKGKSLITFLKDHLERLKELKKALGEGFNPNNLVFFNANGDYIKPSELHRTVPIRMPLNEQGLRTHVSMTCVILTLRSCLRKMYIRKLSVSG